MIRIGVFATALFTLCSCATFGQMDQGLDALRGENIRTAFSVLGYPSRKEEFVGDTVYFWSNNRCIIKIGADQYNTIKTYSYQGNLVGCEPYIFLLNDYYKSKQPSKK